MGTTSKAKKGKSKVIKTRIESIRELTKQLKEMDELTNMENLIKDNVIKFKFEDINYKIRKPSPQEKRETNEKRMKKYVELLKDDKYMLKEQWIEVYKKKGINIREMDEKLIKLQNEYEKLYLQLAKVNNENKEEIERLKNEIVNIKEQQTEISFRKSELLQYSLEDVLEEYVQTYLGFLLLEKKDGDKYIRAFESYDNFMNQDEKLFVRVMNFLSVLFIYGEK
jgi:gas vesicle protein